MRGRAFVLAFIVFFYGHSKAAQADEASCSVEVRETLAMIERRANQLQKGVKATTNGLRQASAEYDKLDRNGKVVTTLQFSAVAMFGVLTSSAVVAAASAGTVSAGAAAVNAVPTTTVLFMIRQGINSSLGAAATGSAAGANSGGYDFGPSEKAWITPQSQALKNFDKASDYNSSALYKKAQGQLLEALKAYDSAHGLIQRKAGATRTELLSRAELGFRDLRDQGLLQVFNWRTLNRYSFDKQIPAISMNELKSHLQLWREEIDFLLGAVGELRGLCDAQGAQLAQLGADGRVHEENSKNLGSRWEVADLSKGGNSVAFMGR